MTCQICGEPAPWIFAAKVPLCSKHYHIRKQGKIFIVEIKENTDLLSFLNKPVIAQHTGKMAIVPEGQIINKLTFLSTKEMAVIYSRVSDFDEIMNSIIYKDE